MTETTVPPYIGRAPGDLVTAEDWNGVQAMIYDDIRTTSQEAADSVTHVATADDSAHLEGQDVDELTAEITRRVLDEVRGRSGYQQLFKILKRDEFSEIEHGLGTPPLVDVYKLEYFEVVCREDEETRAAFATFYLHHSSERRIRVTDENGNRRSIDIQPKDFFSSLEPPAGVDFPDLGIPFADMLTRYGVEYTDSSTLDDLETEFWKAFFRDPNDQFGDDQYCHSPWFERCCKNDTTVEELKASGDWNDMIFQMRPWKTVNFTGQPGNNDNIPSRPAAPMNVAVAHLDNNRTAIWRFGDAEHGGPREDDIRDYIGDEFDNETKVMVLLKV